MPGGWVPPPLPSMESITALNRILTAVARAPEVARRVAGSGGSVLRLGIADEVATARLAALLRRAAGVLAAA